MNYEQFKELAQDWVSIKCKINWEPIEWKIFNKNWEIWLGGEKTSINYNKPWLLYKNTWFINELYFDNLSDIEFPDTFKEWELVEVSEDNEYWEIDKFIYLCTIPWNSCPKYSVVSKEAEEEYKKWNEFDCIFYKYIRKINKSKEYTLDEIASALNIDVKDLKIKK